MKKKTYIKAIGIMVSTEMHKSIIQICNEQELAISEFIRAAIEMKLTQEINDNNITDK